MNKETINDLRFLEGALPKGVICTIQLLDENLKPIKATDPEFFNVTRQDIQVRDSNLCIDAKFKLMEDMTITGFKASWPKGIIVRKCPDLRFTEGDTFTARWVLVPKSYEPNIDETLDTLVSRVEQSLD